VKNETQNTGDKVMVKARQFQVVAWTEEDDRIYLGNKSGNYFKAHAQYNQVIGGGLFSSVGIVWHQDGEMGVEQSWERDRACYHGTTSGHGCDVRLTMVLSSHTRTVINRSYMCQDCRQDWRDNGYKICCFPPEAVIDWLLLERQALRLVTEYPNETADPE